VDHHRIYDLTALGRPVDPAWPTNRLLLYLLPLLALFGTALAWNDGGGPGAVALGAFRGALLGFGAWAVARELAPDDQPAAFIAVALAMTTLLNVPEPGFLLLFLAMTLARVLNRSTGVDLKKTDALAVLGLAGGTAWSLGSPWPMTLTAVAFFWTFSFYAGGEKRQNWLLLPCGVALVAATALVVILGPGIGGEPLSRHGVLLPGLFGLGFLVVLLATRRVRALGDIDQQPLTPSRVRAGMAIALALAVANLVQGSPLAAEGVALWSVLGGVALGRGLGLVLGPQWRTWGHGRRDLG